MKVWKKLSAVALALMMVLALCVMASADEPATLGNNGVVAGNDNAAIANTLTIPKTLTVTGSTDLSKVYTPAVTYAYTVTAPTVTDITVNDGTHTARPVKAGILGTTESPALTVSSVTFPASEVTLTNGSGTVPGNVTVTVDLNQFSAAGIYRYAITENTDNTSALYTAGVTRPAVDNFFLDVYIKNDTSGTNNLSVYGFVLLDANVSITSTDTAHKVSALTTDEYHTMDISVTKSVTGNMGDKTNEFPFAMTVSNSGLNFYSGKGTVGSASTETSLNTTLKDGESYVIKGLNPKATVTFTETNNTPDEYTVSVTGATPAVTEGAVAAGQTKATSALPVSNYDTANTSSALSTTAPTATNSAITFINNLEAISPTGVVLRYAPYLAMLGAGIVVVPLSRRKKEEEL